MFVRLLLKLADKFPIFANLKGYYQRRRDGYYLRQPIDDKLIVFEAFRSSKYADSPRAIYEYMLQAPEYRDYKFIWCFEDVPKHSYLANERTRLVKHDSRAYFLAFAQAKYWVVNGWLSLRVKKKPGQVALQCWHGTPLKKLRYDISANTKHYKNSLRDNDLDMARYDYLISPSRFASERFTSAFNLKALGKQDIIIEMGYPRNDFLFNYTDDDVQAIKQDLKLPADKKVILYAPTWRDDQQANAGGYAYQSPLDFDYLQTRLSSEYVILFRAHNLVSNQFDFTKYADFVYDVSDYEETSHLYVISDVLITDYSSVFFDYANLHRPIIFYMYDLDHYENDLRGFYIDLAELPGAVAIAEQEVVGIINDLQAYNKKYAYKYEVFNTKFNYLDCGRSSEMVTKKIISNSN